MKKGGKLPPLHQPLKGKETATLKGHENLGTVPSEPES